MWRGERGLSPGATAPPLRSRPPAPQRGRPRTAGRRPTISKLSLDRRGRLTLQLRCPRASDGCSGSLKVLTRGSRKRLAVVAYQLRAGEARRVRLRLSRRSHAALLAAGRRTVRVLGQSGGAPPVTLRMRVAGLRR